MRVSVYATIFNSLLKPNYKVVVLNIVHPLSKDLNDQASTLKPVCCLVYDPNI